MHSKPTTKGYWQIVVSVWKRPTAKTATSFWFMNLQTMTDITGCSQMTWNTRKMLHHPGEAWVNSKFHLKLWLHVGDHTGWQHSYSASWDNYDFTGMGKISLSNYELASGISAVYERPCQMFTWSNPCYRSFFFSLPSQPDLSRHRQTQSIDLSESTWKLACEQPTHSTWIVFTLTLFDTDTAVWQ